MTSFLLDVNVLIALLDAQHVHHDVAHDWFKTRGKHKWATCPLTENGVIRIVSNPKYPNYVSAPLTAIDALAQMRKLPGYEFWPDDISLVNNKYIDAKRLLSSGQITDTYLLALASAHGGQLATFDNRLIVDAVHQGLSALHLIA